MNDSVLKCQFNLFNCKLHPVMFIDVAKILLSHRIGFTYSLGVKKASIFKSIDPNDTSNY